MGKTVITSGRLFAGGYDLSGRTNRVAFEPSTALLECTTLDSGGVVERLPGLGDTRISGAGYWDNATGVTGDLKTDNAVLDRLGLSEVPVTWTESSTLFCTAYSVPAQYANYTAFGQVGEVTPYSFEAQASGSAPVRGWMMENGQTARTVTGSSGTGQLLGAILAGQSLYAALHVFEVSGTTPSLSVNIASDDAAGFPSSATRGSFTAATAVGSQWLTPVPGAVTDTYWRISWTITGTSPSFKFAVVIGWR